MELAALASSDGPARRASGPQLSWPAACAALLITLSLFAWLAALVVMADMDEGPGTPLHDFPTFLIGWIVMLAAMMLPSELLYVRVFASLQENRTATRLGRISAIAAFLAGYGLAWTAYGILAFGLDAAVREAAIDAISWERAGPALAGFVLFLTGVYQISPLKQACLSHCRAPVSYFARRWRPGQRGALVMGTAHGLVCVGCCWALMAVMFAVGAMSLVWMGLLALVMLAEKLLPFGRRLTLPIAGALWVMGLWVALDPGSAPLLADPLVYGSSICRIW